MTRLKRTSKKALAVLEHPLVRLTMGVILLLAGLDDLLENVLGMEILGLDLHHGIILTALREVMRPLLEFLEGSSNALKAAHDHGGE